MPEERRPLEEVKNDVPILYIADPSMREAENTGRTGEVRKAQAI